MPINNKEFSIEELTNMCEAIKINLNGDDISDLIFCKTKLWPFDYDGYYNAMTQKKSKDIKDVIRKDKRFIIVKRSMKDIQKYHQEFGFYVKYIETLDVLVVLNAELRKIHKRWEWVEIERFFFTRDLRTSFDKNINRFLGYDICGQTAYNDEKSCDTIRCLCNLTVDLTKKAIAFFGGFVWSYRELDCKILRLFDFYDELDLKNIKHFSDSANKSGVRVVVGMLKYGCEDMELGDIPQSFVNKIKKKAFDDLHKYISWHFKYGNAYISAAEFDTSYLQQVGDYCVQRCFRCIYGYKYPLCDSDITIVEYLRVKIDLNIANKGFIRVPVDGYDTGRDTYFSHVTYLISKFDMWYKKRYDFLYKNYLLSVMIHVASCSLFEKLLNLNVGEASHYYQKTIITRFIVYLGNHSESTATDYMQGLFGEIDDTQTELYKALGIPKGLLEYVIQKDKRLYFEYIRIMKEIFAANPDYLRRMDNASYQYLYNSVEEIMSVSYYSSLVIQTLINLVFLFGCKNWKGYIVHVQRLQVVEGSSIRQEEELSDIQKYSNYIEKLVMIKKSIDIKFPMQWKLLGDKITEAEIAINDTYNIVVDEKEYADCTKKFLECSCIWEKYEYIGTDYVIQSPKKPSELVNEGFWLNHCAKTYIEAVANQKTMVLFIRRKTCPNKPFYTLEIRDNKIRQCHGFNNTNIEFAPGLEEFLKSYCRIKHITFSEGTSCLQA